MREKLTMLIEMFLLIIIPIVSVNAATCANDDRIMKLFSVTNSHGAVWDPALTTYTEDICYSDIYGTPYAGGSPHTCTGSNKVIGLSDVTNSHGEEPSLGTAGYDTDVCYGDLVCEEDTSAGDGCLNGGQIVVRLFSSTNSHISNAGDTNYPNKICCQSGGVPPVSTVYWAHLNASETENAEIGDTVWMIYPDEPGSYNFDIYENDLLSNPFIRTVPSTGTFHRDADLVADWKITQSDWDIGKDLDGSNEFFFDVNSQISEDLNVAEGSYNNDIPVTQIILPEYGSNYTLGVGGATASISFEQISDDPDDYLKGMWTFGDGENSGWMNYCSKTGIGTDCNTTHQYTGKGAIDITFRVEEMTRSQWNDDSTRIFVYGPGINVLAIITEPKYNKTVEGKAVYIDASESKVINCSYSLAECNNAASPATCDTIDDAEGINPTLYCYQLPNRGVDYNLIFEWTFDGVIGKIGNWGAGNDGYYDYVEFVQGFRDPGEHVIGLRVGYEAI